MPASTAPGLREMIRAVGPIPVSVANDIAGATQSYDFEDPNGIVARCNKIPHRYTNTFDSIAAFDPHSDVLWAGSLVQGKSLKDGVLAPIALPRTPGTMTLHYVGIAGTHSQRLTTPDVASASDALAALLARNNKAATPARISTQIEEMRSLKEGMLRIGVLADWLGGSCRGELLEQTSSARTRYISSGSCRATTPPRSRPRERPRPSSPVIPASPMRRCTLARITRRRTSPASRTAECWS